MPKKFKGECSKATVARARKEAVRVEEKARVQREAEDEYWRDDDKVNQNKANRKDDKERKRLEALERKRANDALLEQEQSSMKSCKPSNGGANASSSKVTRHQINSNAAAAAAAVKSAKISTCPNATPVAASETPIEENMNRLVLEDNTARTVHEAIAVLSDSPASHDKHPEKRMKALYQEFEEETLPDLRAQYPNQRLSQLKHMLQKLWQKSPTNPMSKVNRP